MIILALDFAMRICGIYKNMLLFKTIFILFWYHSNRHIFFNIGIRLTRLRAIQNKILKSICWDSYH